MNKLYKSVTEWDIGLGGAVYTSLAVLKEDQIKHLRLNDIHDDYDELVSEGLVDYEEVELVVEGTSSTHGSLALLTKANRVRAQHWEGADEIDTLFRAVEFGGEAGELLDAVKKLTRAQRGIAGNKGKTMADLRQAVMEEIGDVLISLDILADDLGLPIADCVPMKFNKTSRKVDVEIEMDEDTWETVYRPSA